MAQNTVDNNSEAFRILQDNLSSSRGKDMTTDEVEKSIRGNKNLLKIYKEIEASLKKSGDLYKQNRANLDYINKLNKDTFKTLKNDAVTRKQINDLNRQNIKYLDETQDLVRESLRNDIDSKKIKEKIQKLNNEMGKSERARLEQSEKIKDTYEDVYDLIKKNENNLKLGVGNNIGKLIKEIKDLDNAGRKAFEDLANAEDDKSKTKILNKIKRLDKKQKDLYERIDLDIEVEDKNGNINQKATDKLRNQFETILSEAFAQSSVAKTFSLSENILQDTVHELHQQQKRAEKSEKQIGVIGKIFDGLGKTPLNSLVDFNQAKDRMKDAGALGQSTGISALKSMAGSSAIAQAGLLGGGYMVIKQIVEWLAKADNRLTNLAKSFNVSKDEAGVLYEHVRATANDFGKIGINLDDVVKSQLDFNNAFGYSVLLSTEMLQNISKVTKLVGLSTEATNELIKQSLTTKQSISEIETEILGQLAFESKGLLSNKNMMEKVLNISGAIRTNFKGNVSEITKAIVKAKEYGMTLEKTNQIGDSLLDWESSISNQLDARLITGKNINLEQARYYALMGNTAGLMDEIHKNVGDYESFYNMNVIQQQSFAKAVGMTRDELSDMYYEEKISHELMQAGNKKFKEDQISFLSHSDKFKKEYSVIMNNGILSQSEKIAQLGKVGVRNLEQLSAEQKFAEVLEKMKDKIAQLFGNGAILDKMADGLIRVMNTLGIVSDTDEKEILADRIALSTDSKMTQKSPEYKNMMSMLMGQDLKTLRNESSIISLESVTDKKSPEYKNIRKRAIDDNAGWFDDSVNKEYQSEMIDKLNELIKATKESANKDLKMNGVSLTGVLKQNGLG
jgi:hypothetical protein